MGCRGLGAACCLKSSRKSTCVLSPASKSCGLKAILAGTGAVSLPQTRELWGVEAAGIGGTAACCVALRSRGSIIRGGGTLRRALASLAATNARYGWRNGAVGGGFGRAATCRQRRRFAEARR